MIFPSKRDAWLVLLPRVLPIFIMVLKINQPLVGAIMVWVVDLGDVMLESKMPRLEIGLDSDDVVRL